MCYSPRGITVVTVGATYIRAAHLQVEVLSEMFFTVELEQDEK